MIRHCLAIDYESWTGDPGVFGHLTTEARRALDGEATRRQGYALLELLRRYQVCATWFVMGEVAAWHPDVIEAIRQEGHEVGYHTHYHPHLLTPELLRRDLAASASFLAQYAPPGFQAPRIYLPRGCYAILREAGFRYSSSVYGDTAAPFLVDGVCELPVSTYCFRAPRPAQDQFPRALSPSLLSREIPYGSSLLLGLVGARGIAHWIRAAERRRTRSNLFIHNWQLFDSGLSERRFRRKLVLKNPCNWPYARRVLTDFSRLLDEFRFGPLRDAVPSDDAHLPRYRG